MYEPPTNSWWRSRRNFGLRYLRELLVLNCSKLRSVSVHERCGARITEPRHLARESRPNFLEHRRKIGGLRPDCRLSRRLPGFVRNTSSRPSASEPATAVPQKQRCPGSFMIARNSGCGLLALLFRPRDVRLSGPGPPLAVFHTSHGVQRTLARSTVAQNWRVPADPFSGAIHDFGGPPNNSVKVRNSSKGRCNSSCLIAPEPKRSDYDPKHGHCNKQRDRISDNVRHKGHRWRCL